MTPKEKAEELVHSFLTAAYGTMEEYVPIPYIFAKQCAIIAVEQTILALKQARQWTEYLSSAFADIDNDMNYWINVHKELESYEDSH